MPRIAACALLLALASFVGGQPPPKPPVAADPPKKRPLTYADQDIWGSATGVTLSPDGRFVAYTLAVPNVAQWQGGKIVTVFPTEAKQDGVVIVDLARK